MKVGRMRWRSSGCLWVLFLFFPTLIFISFYTQPHALRVILIIQEANALKLNTTIFWLYFSEELRVVSCVCFTSCPITSVLFSERILGDLWHSEYSNEKWCLKGAVVWRTLIGWDGTISLFLVVVGGDWCHKVFSVMISPKLKKCT